MHFPSKKLPSHKKCNNNDTKMCLRPPYKEFDNDNSGEYGFRTEAEFDLLTESTVSKHVLASIKTEALLLVLF